MYNQCGNKYSLEPIKMLTMAYPCADKGTVSNGHVKFLTENKIKFWKLHWKNMFAND